MNRRTVMILAAAASVVVLSFHHDTPLHTPISNLTPTSYRWHPPRRVAINLGGDTGVQVQLDPLPPPGAFPSWSKPLANMPDKLPPPAALPPLSVPIGKDVMPSHAAD